MMHDDLSADQLLRLLRQMIEIRRFEEEVARLFSQNLVRASTHLCIGQEAVPVGVCAALDDGDYRGRIPVTVEYR